ncbi:hypothetical protein ASG12_17790 [Williamsia sp. Leaf354]|jgi:hypothetical protein|uniref:DUF4153 domain-containing protein n=1 Tax=Williamsia sp. Leaf354 TaxID=1736349 RepID=UPI0006F57514|nr:DUF4173 domain-containing protein [Williamsia sp. Leaf354]KQR96083.1 hypothetical protein ASG12_17790 [Williamsia sp. Leaf354]
MPESVQPDTTPPSPGLPWGDEPYDDTRWWMVDTEPDTPAAAPRRVLVVVVLTAIAAAVSMPSQASGIGMTLIGIAVIAAVLVGSPRRPSIAGILAVVAVVALLSVTAWRSAGWVSATCLALAVVTALAVVVDARSARETALGAVLPIVFAPQAVRWVSRTVADARAGRRIDNVRGVAAVAALTVVLAVVFGALFATADTRFADLLDDVTPDLGPVSVGPQVVVGLAAALVVTVGVHLRWVRPRSPHRPAAPRPLGDTWMWAVPAGTVLGISVAFLLTQAPTLFGGDDYVQTTAGLTYADYARSGFWQLFVVTALTIVVVSVAWRRSARDTRTERALARGILGGLCLATLAVVASALHRMDLYTGAFGATRLRVGASAVEWWFAAVVVVLMAAGVGLRTRHLPRIIAAVTIGAALAFAVSNPDARIAATNVDRFADTGRIDIDYLAGLSPDATEELLDLPRPIRDCALAAIAADVADTGRWTDLDLGRAHARTALDGAGIAPTATCPPR